MNTGTKVLRITVGVFCCLVQFAYASSTSEMHRTKAIAALAEGKLEQAKGELDQAVLADANDTHARFYRGIVNSRLGEYEMAADDLKAVMEADLPYQNLHFELGYVDFHLERLNPAKGELEVAIEQKPDFAPAQYYLGVVLYQLKEYQACLEPLKRAASLDRDFDAAASFMRGDSLIYLGRGKEAESILQAAIDTYPDSIYTKYSRQALVRLEPGQHTKRRWYLDLEAGGSYDSNVGLFADDRALPAGIEEMEDGRAQFALNGSYTLWNKKNKSLTAGYRFFQSYHQDLADYDMQNHTISADYRHELERRVWGLNLQYVITRLGGEDYRNRGILSPYLIWKHGQNHSSFFQLRATDEQYQVATQEPRDGNTYEGLYRHYWLQGERHYVFAGIHLDKDDAQDEQYSYTGYGLEGGVQHTWSDLTVGAELHYHQRDFVDETVSRVDDYAKGNIKLSYSLMDDLELVSNVSAICNQSTSEDHDYRRTVANLMLRWRL